MAELRTRPFQTNFTAGELSSRLDGRVDITRYANGLETLSNFICHPHGGVSRRPGTRFAGTVKTHSQRVRLLPFQFSEKQSYILEFGHLYIRFWTNGGQIQADEEVLNGAFNSDVSDWTNASTGDAGFLWEPDVTGNGRMLLGVRNSGVAWARQAISVAAGQPHTFEFRTLSHHLAPAASLLKVGVGTTAAGSELLNTSVFFDPVAALDAGPPGSGRLYRFTVTPTVGTIYLQFAVDVVMTGGYIDEVSFRRGGAVEVVSPYTETDLPEIEYEQSADVLWLCHPKYEPRKLTRTSHTNWNLDVITFKDGPYLPSSLNVATAVLFASDDYYVTDNNNDGWGNTVTEHTSNQLVVGSSDAAGVRSDHRTILKFDISSLQAFRNIVRATLKLQQVSRADVGTYPVKLDYMPGGPDGQSASEYELTAFSDLGTILDRQQTKSVEFDVTASVQDTMLKAHGAIKFRLRPVAVPTVGIGTNESRVFVVKSEEDGTQANRPTLEVEYETGTYLTPTGISGAITINASGALWGSNDIIGAFYRLTHGAITGYVKVTGRNSTTQITADVKKALGGTYATGVWQEGAWSTVRGFPRVPVLYEDRMCFASNNAKPLTIWGSKTGDYDNFTPGALDDDAVTFNIASRDVQLVRWLVAARQLLVGSNRAEFKMFGGGDDQPITPSTIKVRTDTNYGSARIRPVRIGNVVLYVQRSGKKVRELVFDFNQDAYVAAELSILSEHIPGAGVREIAWQQEKDPILWCVLEDGRLGAMTYERSHEVVGWHQHTTDGIFESVCTIPHPTEARDQVWIAVRRTIAGQTKRYIEYLDDDGLFYPALYTDSALTYDGAPATSFSGLDHLEGKTVRVVGDGAAYPDAVVAAGAVTISPAASRVEIGLPYTSTLRTLRVEVPANGTSQGQKKRWVTCMVRLLNTIGVKLNGERLPFRLAGDDMDQPVPMFSGDKEVPKLGWDREGRITVEQDQALPCTVLGLSGTLYVSDT